MALTFNAKWRFQFVQGRVYILSRSGVDVLVKFSVDIFDKNCPFSNVFDGFRTFFDVDNLCKNGVDNL